MTTIDDASRALVGTTIWHVARWLEAHNDGEAYEIFDGKGEARYGYKITVERVPYLNHAIPAP